MKKMIATIVMVLGCGLTAFGGSDVWTDAKGVTWSFDWSGSESSGYTAKITDCDAAGLSSVTIPATVYADGGSRSCKVTRIASYAIYWCTSLESVVIPASVTTIDNYAFYGSWYINSVTFKGAVPSGCNFDLAFYKTDFLAVCQTSNWFDNFTNPYMIAGASGSVQSDNYLATVQTEEPLKKIHHAGNTKWFKWTAPKSGTVWFHTQGSKFDTIVGIYQGGTLSALNEVACNDDFMSDRTSQLSFEAVGGETYCICVGGFASGRVRGEFTLAWRMGAPVTLTLDPNGGTMSDSLKSVSVPKNAAVGGLPTPTKSDYTMSAWYTKKTGGTKVTAKTKFAKDTKLFARWAKTKFKVAVSAGNTGSKKLTGAGTYAWDSKATLTAKPKSGYVFWYWMAEDSASKGAFSNYAAQQRKDSVKITVPKSAVSYRAFFVKKSDDAISMAVTGATEFFAEDGSGSSQRATINVSSISYPKVTASGVPAGVKFKVESGSDNVYTLAVTDELKIPAGRHAIKVTAKNRSGKSVSKTFVVWGFNNAVMADAGYITLPNRSAKTPDEMNVGIAPNWGNYGIVAQQGYKISKIDGLPSGLAWESKHQTLTGVPMKSGRFSLTITIKKGSKKYTVTTTFYVNALPSSVVGTFRGYTAVGGTTFGAGSRVVTVTVSKDGKISATSGDYKMSGFGFQYYSGTPNHYIADLDGSYKDKKKTEYIRRLHFQIYDPAGYYANDAVGDLTHGTKKKGGVADTRLDNLCLRKNIFGRKADGTALVNEKAQSMLEYVALYQDNKAITASSGHVVTLKFNKDANGRLNGFVTLSGDLGSGSAMLFYEGQGSTTRYLVARFKVGVRAVEARYKMTFYSSGESAAIKSTYAPTATVWAD